MITTVAITTVVWLAVTFLTAPEKTDILVAFYRRTRPSRQGGGRSPRSRRRSSLRAMGSPIFCAGLEAVC